MGKKKPFNPEWDRQVAKFHALALRRVKAEFRPIVRQLKSALGK